MPAYTPDPDRRGPTPREVRLVILAVVWFGAFAVWAPSIFRALYQVIR